MNIREMTKNELIQHQLDETVEQESLGITVRMATITCGCGWERALTKMYKCLYCNEWFCISCAEKHFNKTISEYKSEKFDELVSRDKKKRDIYLR